MAKSKKGHNFAIQGPTGKKKIQSTLVISDSVISNKRLSRSENLVPVLT